MPNYKTLRSFDVTTRKSEKIEFLERMVNDAATIAARSEANYHSFVMQANLFAEQYEASETTKNNAAKRWKLFQEVASDLNSTNAINNESNLVAIDAFHGIRQLIIAWKEVTDDTIKAAEAIILTSDFIQKRKATNPLISNDLVNDAIAAASAAKKTVYKVTLALTAALSTLSASTQAKNSTELTDVYINIAISILLKKKDSNINSDKLLKTEKISSLNRTAIQALTDGKSSLEEYLKNDLAEATTHNKQAFESSERTNKEMKKAKEELAQAQATLATWEAALVAAETAVAG